MIPDDKNPYAEMSWTEYARTNAGTILGIEATIIAYVLVCYALSEWIGSDGIWSIAAVMAPMLQFYVAIRLIGVKRGITSEDLY